MNATNKIIASLTNSKRALEITLDYLRGVLQSEHFPTPKNADQRIFNRKCLVYAFDYLQIGHGEVDYSLNRLSKLVAENNKNKETITSLANAKRALESALDYLDWVLKSKHFPTPKNADQRIFNRRCLSYAFDYFHLGFGEVEYSLKRLSK